MTLLTRSEALIKVEPFVIVRSSCKAVLHSVCEQMLGPDKFKLLLEDPIRNKGPSLDTVYPWNLVDYLCNENPRVGSKSKLVTEKEIIAKYPTMSKENIAFILSKNHTVTEFFNIGTIYEDVPCPSWDEATTTIRNRNATTSKSN